MLQEVRVNNLALINRLELDFSETGPGLVAFTGETGAGKSIIQAETSYPSALKMQRNNHTDTHQEEINQSRRTAIRKIATGTVALAGCSLLSQKWSTPIIEFGALPAHATTSGLEELIKIVEQRHIEDIEKETEETEQPAQAAEEEVVSIDAAPQSEAKSDLRGYNNKLIIQDTGAIMFCDGVRQHKIVFPKLGPQYGNSLLLVWSDGNELSVPDSRKMAMKGDKNDYRKYQPGGSYSGNNPDIPTMEVYAKRGTHPSSVTLYY
ncbi:MAG: hypothetical protein SD837_11560 [Candidatus Electrothrix scaldis]|nr:MAG: hypothetical protein SD837_11560 [Candidatus Electrothrix sp. GW3-3]